MRRLRFIPALLVILSACSERIIEQDRPVSDEMGTLSIALSSDMQTEYIGTKADADEPALEDFRVAIYKKETKVRLYNDSYANTVGKEIKLNAGDYRLVAQHGDSLGCGFNKAYFLADKEFTINVHRFQGQMAFFLYKARLFQVLQKLLLIHHLRRLK